MIELLDTVDKLCKKIEKLDKNLSYNRIERPESDYISILYKDVEVYIITKLTLVTLGKDRDLTPLYNEFKHMFQKIKEEIDYSNIYCFECRKIVSSDNIGKYYGPGNWMCDSCIENAKRDNDE